jgi:hypothetical protein
LEEELELVAEGIPQGGQARAADSRNRAVGRISRCNEDVLEALPLAGSQEGVGEGREFGR